jgi:hypothetical protein
MSSNNPGNTDLSSYSKFNSQLSNLHDAIEIQQRKSIILASNDVNDTTLFLNGLTQNILILYDLFECMGYKSYLLQYSTNNGTNHSKQEFLQSYRIITTDDIIRKPIPIHAFIEIGMSVDSIVRSYLRSHGAKIIKLYLGNILNIDIETIQNCSSLFFYHHLVGELDEVWVSPHYKQHMEYASLLNRTEIHRGRIAPYVWDSCFITQYGTKDTIQWRPIADWKTVDIVIMDPNISFQKCSFYSILLAEAFSRKYPEWLGKVHIINGDRLKMVGNVTNFVLPSLSLYKNGRIILHGRKTIHTILRENRSACFMTHQWNNDFNYMTLELLYCNYPILHNSSGWDMFGYYYDINKWNDAIQTLYRAISSHYDNLNIYKSHAANLIWKHSIHNPEIHQEWRHIL